MGPKSGDEIFAQLWRNALKRGAVGKRFWILSFLGFSLIFRWLWLLVSGKGLSMLELSSQNPKKTHWKLHFLDWKPWVLRPKSGKESYVSLPFLLRKGKFCCCQFDFFDFNPIMSHLKLVKLCTSSIWSLFDFDTQLSVPIEKNLSEWLWYWYSLPMLKCY